MHYAIRIQFLLLVLLAGSGAWTEASHGAEGSPSGGRIWKQLVAEAEQAGLPTKFLKVVPTDFVTFEFDDLQTYAAEYHLPDHRMVLNRTLSFNAAGGTLRPLSRMTHVEKETLYHELFHAYMDYLATHRSREPVDALLAYARGQQRCRYSTVLINPVMQRRSESEERFLTEQESWEALNEAWAVFIGWAVWSQLELSKGVSIDRPGKARETWLRRLQEADRHGKLRGYYEPENLEERAVARKRFLAQESRLSREEIARLMDEALGYSHELIQQAMKLLPSTTGPEGSIDPCRKR